MGWPLTYPQAALGAEEAFAGHGWETRRSLARHPADSKRLVELMVNAWKQDSSTARELRELRQRVATLEEAFGRLAGVMIGEGKLAALRDAFSDMESSRMPWLRVVEPPRAEPGTKASPGSEDLFRSMSAALKAARATHPGQWVALRGGSVVDADADRVALHRRLEAQGLLGQLFFARIPPW